jgi:hypothetical protein
VEDQQKNNTIKGRHKLAISRKDRSFDKIFQEVTLGKVPMEYVFKMYISLMNGDTIEIDRSTLLKVDDNPDADFLSGIDKAEIKDIQLSIDYESIKKDVSGGVKKLMDIYFDDGENSPWSFKEHEEDDDDKKDD